MDEQFEKRFEDFVDANKEQHQELKERLKVIQSTETNCQINHLPHIDSKLVSLAESQKSIAAEQKVLKRLTLISMSIGIGIVIENWDKLIALIKLIDGLF